MFIQLNSSPYIPLVIHPLPVALAKSSHWKGMFDYKMQPSRRPESKFKLTLAHWRVVWTCPEDSRNLWQSSFRLMEYHPQSQLQSWHWLFSPDYKQKEILCIDTALKYILVKIIKNIGTSGYQTKVPFVQMSTCDTLTRDSLQLVTRTCWLLTYWYP